MTGRAGRIALWAVLALSLSLNLAAGVGYFAAKSRLDAVREGRGALQMLAEELDLGADQRARFRATRTAMRDEVREARAAGATLMDAFWTEIGSPAPDPTRLDALVDERAEQVRGLNRLLAGRIAEFAASLEPAQRARLAELMRPVRILGGRFLMSGKW